MMSLLKMNFFLYMRQKYIINTNIDKIMKIKMIKTYNSKNCYQVWHSQIITKILKNVQNVVELAVKVEKSNSKRLHSRIKLIKIMHVLLETLAASFE